MQSISPIPPFLLPETLFLSSPTQFFLGISRLKFIYLEGARYKTIAYNIQPIAMKSLFLTISIFLNSVILFAQPIPIPKKAPINQHNHQHDHGHNHGHDHNDDQQIAKNLAEQITPNSNGISFIKNLNQWHENVAYQAGLGGLSSVFLEQKKFTYNFTHLGDVGKIHETSHDKDATLPIRGHAYKVHFKNALDVEFKEDGKHQEIYNYFLGNDPDKWASKVPIYDQVTYPNLYQGIDLVAYNKDGHFKYDFIVSPGISPAAIAMEYEGADAVEIDNSNLIIHTSVINITEQKPYAFQIINGKTIVVPCEYDLHRNTVSFVFPEGYNTDFELVIDPTVVASTLSGMSLTYSFGHSATFDNQGNIYAGGRAYGIGYQSTTGAFQESFGGGGTDIAVTKYNPEGTAQIYATYIGGNDVDAPHSMIADFNGQLYIFGSSSSSDYPVTTNAFQNTKGELSDIVVTKLNTDGSELVGSTFVGGDQSDGINQSVLNDNYDDHFRGEIVLDNQGNAYIASCSSSPDFPTTPGAYDTDYNDTGFPGQDGVVFKLNNDLSTLFWATYLGEGDADTAYGLRVDDFGNVYVTGIAGNSDFPTTGGVIQSAWPGGEENAYVTVFNPTGTALIASTFWGSSGAEHSYFIDIDELGNIHIYGQTTGDMPVTAGTYVYNEGSSQFLSSFTSDLTSVNYSTVIGTGPNSFGYDFVPVAFMVDKCNNIYFSGYYAVNNLPTTNDAISTVGGSVYLGVLDPFATGLQFGTYYGDADHVDGGTSRFDKSGTVYQGVCSCTNGDNVLNTLPGAFATGQSTFCDIGVFKIDFEIPTVTAAGVPIPANTTVPANSGCAPFDVDFFYTGQDGTVFYWDFDDNGATSTNQDANHVFTEPGTYEVMLIVTNQLTCNSVDTAFLVIDVLESSSTLTNSSICNPDETSFLDASTTNATYTWQDGSTNSTYSANGPGVYWVDVSLLNGACTRRDSFVLVLNNSLNLDLGPDFSVCDENSFTLDATTPGATAYEWGDGSTNPTLDIFTTGTYSVIAFDGDGCAAEENITVTFSTTPVFNLGPDTLLCDLYTVSLDPQIPGAVYTWQDGSNTDIYTVTDPGIYWVEANLNGCIGNDSIEVSYLAEVFLDIQSVDVDCNDDCDAYIDITMSGGNGDFSFLWNTGETQPDLNDLCAGDYILTVTDDLCNYVLATIEVEEPGPLAYDFEVVDVVCPGDGDGVISIVNITGGTPPYSFSINGGPFTPNATINNLDGGNYDFVMSDANGCIIGETISIYEPPAITVSAGEDFTIELGEQVEIQGLVFPNANQNISWSPNETLSCIECEEPIANPVNTTIYTLTVVDSITGCVITDQMVVNVEKNRNVFVPNIFSPNGDGANDIFEIYTGNGVRRIVDIKVFDRWGEVVFANEDILKDDPFKGWDGTLKGKPMNTAVYAWYAEIEFLDDVVILYKGDVTLVK